MYDSLLQPWSPPHLAQPPETAYRDAGLQRTKGTIFLLPPPISTLKSTYNDPPRPKTRMSSGAVALCKHFERGGASSEHGRLHSYWMLPKGSNERKTEIAQEVLDRMLGEVTWRNVMLLHPGVAVYEVRNRGGWGMRWTLDVGEVNRDETGGVSYGEEGTVSGDEKRYDDEEAVHDRTGNDASGQREPNPDSASREWKIIKTTFRGFVEPIEGMDHELDKP